jgi:hypothetical protein
MPYRLASMLPVRQESSGPCAERGNPVSWEVRITVQRRWRRAALFRLSKAIVAGLCCQRFVRATSFVFEIGTAGALGVTAGLGGFPDGLLGGLLCKIVQILAELVLLFADSMNFGFNGVG